MVCLTNLGCKRPSASFCVNPCVKLVMTAYLIRMVTLCDPCSYKLSVKIH